MKHAETDSLLEQLYETVCANAEAWELAASLAASQRPWRVSEAFWCDQFLGKESQQTQKRHVSRWLAISQCVGAIRRNSKEPTVWGPRSGIIKNFLKA